MKRAGKRRGRNDERRGSRAVVRHTAFILLTSLFLLGWGAAMAQNASIVTTPHNLSAGGPGQVRAASEQEVCIFCHTPHHATPVQPLWNRNTPVTAYTTYSSTSLDATPGQPTGTSKLCLSCHDGTIGLGSVVSRNQPIQMASGMTTLPPGRKSNLGSDLSDDHPISIRYDSPLVAKDTQLKDPATLPPALRLDGNAEIQCTTCHDAHDNRFGQFLVMDNTSSQMCNSCHIKGTTNIAGHQACASCHAPHTAPSGPHLLHGVTITETCLTCHDGTGTGTQGANILADLNKPARHDARASEHDRTPAGNKSVVMCNDCHGVHSMNAGTAAAPAISPKLGQVSGVNLAGSAVAAAQAQYEVCFKCHGDQAVLQPTISRQVVQNNTRLQFAPSAVSFHPVAAGGRNTDVPSLAPGLTSASIIYCADCHASDASKVAGGTGPNGPHGSSNRPLLAARYETTDMTAESEAAYALCYKCHQRTSILSNASFSEHSRHVVTAQTPCSACHDAHGIASVQGTAINHSHLINFDLRVVRANAQGALEYRSTGSRTGQCSLSCHGHEHAATQYPPPLIVGPLPGTPTTSPAPVVPPPPLAPTAEPGLRRLRRR